jgi:hypothetical protein
MAIHITHKEKGVYVALNTGRMFFPKDKYRPYISGKELLVRSIGGDEDVLITNDAADVASITDDVDPPGPSPAATLQGIFDQIYGFFFRRPVIYLKTDDEKLEEAYGWGDHGIEGYITDAPSGGQPYSRKYGEWVLAASGGSGTVYKIYTMPQAQNASGSVAYTGFSLDMDAATSGADWAVKRMYEAGTEAWAGKTTFDQILDDYESLTYS